jgi:polar amino acid transport system substrate-binding protein
VHAGPPRPLAFCYEDVPQFPWTRPDETGLNFELLKRVEKQLGEQFRYEVKPWKRCIEEVRVGIMDGVIGAAESPERRSFGAFATLPNGQIDPRAALYEESYRIFTRVGSTAGWDGHTLRAPNGVVLVQSGYLIADLLRQRGFKPVESARSAEDGLRMLIGGSYDIAALYGAEAEALARSDPRFVGKIAQAPTTYSDWSFYLLISRMTFDTDKKRINAIWRAIRTVRESDEYRKLASAVRTAHSLANNTSNNDN